MSSEVDIVVIGAGLSGLVAAWRAAAGGKKVRLLAKGWGATHWHSGCIDVLGYLPGAAGVACESPSVDLAKLIQANPRHPYALVEVEGLFEALTAFQELCLRAGYPLHGSLERNWMLPSAVGAARPTCLAPDTMVAGDLRRDGKMTIVGFRGLNDFYPGLVASNLTAQGFEAEGVMLELRRLKARRLLNPVLLAGLFEDPDFRDEVIASLHPRLADAERIGFPAVLGLHRAGEVKSALEAELGRPVFEIPTLPPSVPGIRLHRITCEAIRQHGGQVLEGMEVSGFDVQATRITSVYSEAAARRRQHRAAAFVLATGGILGGGHRAEFDGVVRETIFDLPLHAPSDRAAWFGRDFLAEEGHRVYEAGAMVDRSLRPMDHHGETIHENLYAAGMALAYFDAIRERSLEGVALATGYRAGKQAKEYATG